MKNMRIQLTKPFARIHIDIIGHLPKTKTGYKYIVVAVDALIRWPEAEELKHKTPHEVA